MPMRAVRALGREAAPICNPNLISTGPPGNARFQLIGTESCR